MESLADFLGLKDSVKDGPDHKDDALDALLDGDLTLEAFARRVLTSREYRLSVFQRIQAGELPPAIERWLYELAVPKTASDTTLGTSEPVIVEIRRVLVRPTFDDENLGKTTH